MAVRMFFIVGFPRSGTTMLANMLNRHSELLVTAETQYFLDMRDRFLEGRLYPLSEFLEFASQGRLRDLCLDPEDYYSFHNPDYRCTTCEYLYLTMEVLAKKYNVDHIGEKSPIHQLYLKQIARCFPSAKFIYVMRDGRDAVLSLMQVNWTQNNLFKHSVEWMYRTKVTQKAMQQIRNKLLIVKYEDIIDNPEEQLRCVCEFLRVGYESRQLVADDTDTPQLVPEWEMDWKKKALELPDPSRKYAWKRAPIDQQALMTRIMAEGLRKYGYEVGRYGNFAKGMGFRCLLLRVTYAARIWGYYRHIKIIIGRLLKINNLMRG